MKITLISYTKHTNNDNYQNVIIVDKNIKGLLLRNGCGIMEMKTKLKERRAIG